MYQQTVWGKARLLKGPEAVRWSISYILCVLPPLGSILELTSSSALVFFFVFRMFSLVYGGSDGFALALLYMR